MRHKKYLHFFVFFFADLFIIITRSVEKNKHAKMKDFYKRKKNLIIQSRILAEHIKRKSSELLQKEVLAIMTNDSVTPVA